MPDTPVGDEREEIEVASTSQDLSVGALSFTTSFSREYRLLSIMVHGSAAFTQTMTVTMDSNIGANYDTVIGKRSVTGVQDIQFVPAANEQDFNSGDEIKIDITNTGSPSVIVYVQVMVAHK